MGGSYLEFNESQAGTRCIYQRHWIEVGAARGADVFTTVSEITGVEAEALLGMPFVLL